MVELFFASDLALHKDMGLNKSRFHVFMEPPLAGICAPVITECLIRRLGALRKAQYFLLFICHVGPLLTEGAPLWPSNTHS